MPPVRVAPARRGARRAANRAGRGRLSCRDDRSFCARRASSFVRYLFPDMTNIFSDFRRLVVVPALEDLVAHGSLPSGLDWSRVAVEPPRDPAHGDLATNAAMVLAGSLKKNPMALAERIATTLEGRELVTGDYRGSGFTVDAVRPGFINVRLALEVWHAQLRAILRAGTAFGDSSIGGGER